MKELGILFIIIGLSVSGFGFYQFTTPSEEEERRSSYNSIGRSLSDLGDSLDSLASNRTKRTDKSGYDKEDDEINKLGNRRETNSFIFMGIGGVLFISGIICINNKK
jgi:hypothetical protein